MIRIIISNKENNICYTIPIFEKLYGIGELNSMVKTKLLDKEKELKKIWSNGTSLLATVYLENKYVGNLSFLL